MNQKVEKETYFCPSDSLFPFLQELATSSSVSPQDFPLRKPNGLENWTNLITKEIDTQRFIEGVAGGVLPLLCLSLSFWGTWEGRGFGKVA